MTLQGSEPTCATAEGGLLLLGDNMGSITLADRNFKNISWTQKAFSGPVRGVAYVYDVLNPRKQYVISVGEESNRSNSSGDGKISSTNDSYVIKVFVTTNMSHPIQAFHAASAIQGDSTLTNFAVTSNGFQIVVGFSCGSVVLFSGNFLADGSSGRQYVPQILLQNHRYAVSGLHFCELFNSSKVSSDRYVRLYVVLNTDEERPKTNDQPCTVNGGALTPDMADITDAGILVFDTSYSAAAGGGGAINRVPPKVLDFRGSSPQCSSLMSHTSELVVGREEGVFSYSVEDRGGAAGFEGQKQCITAVGRYVLVGCMDDKTKRTMITIYDLRHKFISMSHLLPLGETVLMVFHDGGVAYVVTSSWSLIRFREKDTSNKLDVLLRKSLYPLAISLAAEEQADVSEIMSLYKLYADNLYKKNDFDGAIAQYCHTIGFIQPSYVIRRFLDTQRIGNLILYLEKLHSRGIATKDHTTLLLTCYTKTNNEQKLSEFCKLKTSSLSAAAPNGTSGSGSGGVTQQSSGGSEEKDPTSIDDMDLNFDVLTAIQALHSVGFDEHALKLALSSDRHEEYIFISLTSTIVKDVNRALFYLVTIVPKIDIDELVYLITNFSTIFLVENPAAFTGLLIQLCTASVNGQELKELFTTSTSESTSSPKHIHVYNVMKTKPIDDSVNDDKLFLQVCQAMYELPEAFPIEEALNVFADNDVYLRIFLEGVSDIKKKQVLPPRVIELLLEVYLVELRTHREELDQLTTTKQPKNTAFVEISSKIKHLEDKVLMVLDGAIASTLDYDLSQVGYGSIISHRALILTFTAYMLFLLCICVSFCYY